MVYNYTNGALLLKEILMDDLKTRLIEYRKTANNTWTKKITDTDLEQDLLEYPNYSELPPNQKAAAIILGRIPICECGNAVSFQGKRKETINGTPFGGWLEFCSSKCAKSSNKTIEKRKQTCIDRFGTDSWSKTDIAKKTMSLPWSEEKKVAYNATVSKTCIEKYGVDHYSKTEEYLDKRNATVLRQTDGKYTNHFQNVDKIKESNLEKYGVDHYNKTESGRNNLRTNNGMFNHDVAIRSKFNKMKSKYSEELLEILINKDNIRFKSFIDSIVTSNQYKHRHQIAEHLNLSYSYLNAIFREYGMQNEYLTLGTSISFKEQEVFEYVQSLGFTIKRSDRTILDGKEIDILIEQKKLGIEFNGLYYHSEYSGGKDSRYHLDKTELCELKGYQLLHIFENEWNDSSKNKIWKSIIKSKLGLITNRIFARKCTVVELTPKESRKFFDANHLSGFVGASLHVGLYYNDTLVSAISYGKSRFSNNENEIYRFASLLDYQVVGALGKLISKIPNDNLVSFADRRISGVDSAYSKFFNFKHKVGPNWWGIESGNLKHRMSYTKKNVKMLLGELYDENLSVKDNMFANKIDIIHDCGNWKFYN
jgi:hypothetical protein